jgi:hypothetical protein
MSESKPTKWVENNDMTLPKEIWKSKFDAIETDEESLMLLDEIEELDSHGDFHFRLTRCRQLAEKGTATGLGISTWRWMLKSYFLWDWNEADAESNIIKNPIDSRGKYSRDLL